MTSSLELLAPARNAEIGIEAIRHGADAVYIGGPAFGARHDAGNTVADIERLAAYAHRFHARIFITLNTIFRDDEIEEARRLAWQMYEAGADALILQDMGLLETDLPPMELHASTQTDIRTSERARFLADVGFSQIVLARELSLPEIRAIRTKVGAGALCVPGTPLRGQVTAAHAAATYLLVVKLVAMPAAALLLIRYFGLAGLHADIALAFSALPTASSAYILAQRMGGDGARVAWLISAGTLLAMLSLPMWLALA